jgi:hypothetical protein
VTAQPADQPVSRTVDTPELVIRWYLRFNGYLSIENFIVHEPLDGGIAQGTESDILAVRFPYSAESPGFRIENDLNLLDREAIENQLVDFLIAEVKGGKRTEAINSLWRPPATDTKLQRVEYILRWLGPLSDCEAVKRVARALQERNRCLEAGNLFRVVRFGRESLRGATYKQITLREVASFFVRTRASCWQANALGVRSPHDQWHPIIRKLWDLAGPSGSVSEGQRVERVLASIQGQEG